MCGSIIIARSVEYKSVFCWLDMHEENTTTMDLLYEKKKMCFLKFVSLFWKKYYRCRVLKTYFFLFVREEISKMMKMKILMPFLRKSPYLSDCQANRLFYNIASLTTQNVSSRSRAREPRI